MRKFAAVGFALLMVFAVFVPFASAINDPTKVGYQSAYNPNPAGEKSPQNIGHLDVLLACRSPQIGGEFTIVPVVVSAPFTNAARVDKAFVDQFVKQFGEPKTEQYLPDGTFDADYVPGTYLLKQIDGNGGQPEFALVAIKAACKETVVFLGHGISGITEEQKTVITVTEATYGAQKTVVDREAYDETVTDAEAIPAHPEHANGDVVVDVAAHYQHVTDTVVDVPAHFEHVTDTVVDVAEHFEHVTDTVVDVPAHYEHATDTVVDVAEHTETVPATYKQVPCTHVVPATYKTVTCTHIVPEVPAVTHTVTTFHGDYNQTSGHMVYVGANKGEYVPHFDAAAKQGSKYLGQYEKNGGTYVYMGTTGYHYKLTTEGYVAPTVETIIDTPAIPAHPEHPAGDTVVDVPEHFAHVTDTVVDVPEHTITVPATYKQVACTHFVAATYKQVACTHFVAATYKQVACTHAVAETYKQVPCTHFVETTYKTVACTHIIAEVPAVTHIVHHDAITHVEGTFVDVKAEVQALLDGGQQVMVFDNRPNPGGIFDTVGGNLMKTIADPAYGQVKNVHIVFTVNGGAPKTVNAQEYQSITLA